MDEESLPSDIILLIIHKLPTKAAVRCRLLSKKYYNLLTNRPIKAKCQILSPYWSVSGTSRFLHANNDFGFDLGLLQQFLQFLFCQLVSLGSILLAQNTAQESTDLDQIEIVTQDSDSFGLVSLYVSEEASSVTPYRWLGNERDGVQASNEDLRERRSFFQSAATSLTSLGTTVGLAVARSYASHRRRSTLRGIIFYVAFLLDLIAFCSSLLSIQLYFTIPSRGADRALARASVVSNVSLFTTALVPSEH